MSKQMWAFVAIAIALVVLVFAVDPLGFFADDRPEAETADASPRGSGTDPKLQGHGDGTLRDAEPTEYKGEPVGILDLGLGRGVLTGQVQANDLPLPLARVRPVLTDGARTSAVRTRKDGTYEIRGLPLGQHDIRATADLHVGRTVVAPLLAPPAAGVETDAEDPIRAEVETIHLALRVDPQNGIDVKVLDLLGRPIPGAKVLATTMQWDLFLSVGPEVAGVRDVRAKRGRTDEQGKCLINGLHPDRYNLVVSAPGYVTTPVVALTVAENRVRHVNLTLHEGMAMTGTVTNQAGAPVEGAIVGCLHNPSFVSALTTRTDAQGRWTLSGLRKGQQMVFANHDDGGQVIGQAKAPSSGTVLKLGGIATIKGKLLWSDGSPVTEAEIRPFTTQWFGYVYSAVHGDIGADGAYELKLPFGSYLLRVRAAGGEMSEDLSVQVAVGDVLELDITLARTGVVRGVVVGEDGEHIEGAEVYIRMGGTPPSKSREQYARTDADGHFEVEGLKIEPVKLKISHEAYADLSFDATPAPAATAKEVTVRLQRGATIQGTVRDDEGQPIASEQITLFQHMFEPRTTHTGPDGVYRFPGVPAGTYTMKQGVFENMAPGITKGGINVGESGTVVVNFELTGGSGTVRGLVRSGGAPLADASVSIIDDRGSGAMTSATTNAAGEFEAKGVRPGSFNVIVGTAEGLSTSKRGNFEEGSTETRIVIDMGTAGVRGRVIDDAGQPVSGAWVTIESTKAEDMAWSQAKAMKNTGGDGVFEAAGLRPGPYRVRVQTTEHAMLLTKSFQVGEGILNVGDLALKQGGVISGRVTDDAGAPVEDATVSLLDAAGRPVFLWSTATTGSDGRYALQGVEPSRYTVTFEAKGYSPSQNPVTLDAKGAAVDGVLTRGGTLQVKVLDDGGYAVSGARVTLYDSRGKKVEKTLSLINIFDGGVVFTDGKGTARVPDLAAGTYRVVIQKDGYASTDTERSATVTPGETASVEIPLAKK